MVTNIRPFCQQLMTPEFNKPKDLAAWMGAIQAQDYNMSKWAIGIRSQSITIKDVDDALKKGEILRTHIMRPTWHLVAAEDIHWMIQLSAKRIRSAISGYNRYRGITEDILLKSNSLIEKMLEGHKNLTRQEIADNLMKAGILRDPLDMNCITMRAEVDGLICSGADKGKKTTYALLEERVPPAKKLHREEALAKLAKKYFQSHSPASSEDFSWWSGLSITEARQAINLISSELITDKFSSENLLIHESCLKVLKSLELKNSEEKDELYFLPSYDEYLISYKNRTSVLDLEHHPKAFSKNGIFHPVILYKGQVIGNWSKSIKKGKLSFEVSFFDPKLKIRPELITEAGNRYRAFIL